MIVRKNLSTFALAVGICLSLIWSAHTATEVEFRLVPFNNVEESVEELAEQDPVTRRQRTEEGIEVKRIGTRVVCWARNIQLNGEPLFERYHNGEYVGRKPVVKRKLEPGKHTVWPGDHTFSLSEDGNIKTESSELLVDGKTVKIKSYPLKVQAFQSKAQTPEESTDKASDDIVPLPQMTLRNAKPGDDEKAEEKTGRANLDLLPVYKKFTPLTVWTPANTSGKGYRLHPMGLTFHFGPDGVALAAGDGVDVGGVLAEDRTISIPLIDMPAKGDAGVTFAISTLGKFNFESAGEKPIRLFPKSGAYELMLAEDTPVLEMEGNLSQKPEKKLQVDYPDPVIDLRRMALLELPTRHLKQGKSVEANLKTLAVRRTDKKADKKPGENDKKSKQKNEKQEEEKKIPMKEVKFGDAPAFAKLKAYKGNRTESLSVSRKGEHRVTFKIPDVPAGLYYLRVGVAAPSEIGGDLAIEQLVTVASSRPYSAGLFTWKGRNAFYRGEPLRIGLSMISLKEKISAGTDIKVRLHKADDQSRTVFQKTLEKPVKDRRSTFIQFSSRETLNLMPGDYKLKAQVGDYQVRPLPLTLVTREPETHFTNILNGKFSTLGDMYQKLLETGKGEEALTRYMRDSGYNAVANAATDIDRVNWPETEAQRLVKQRPQLGPAVGYYQPDPRSEFLDAAVRHNLMSWETMITYHDCMMPRGETIRESTERFVALETQSMYSNPAFQGGFLYNEIYEDGGMDPQRVVKAFRRAEEQAFRERYGFSSEEALDALNRFLRHGQTKDLKMYRKSRAFKDELWGKFANSMARSIKEVMPSSRNSAYYRYFQNKATVAPNGDETDVFESLDMASWIHYKDGGHGAAAVTTPALADVQRVRENMPIITQLHTFHADGLFSRHLMRQAFFGLSEDIDGFSYFTLNINPENPAYTGNYNTVRDIAKELCTPYGDYFRSLERGYKKVAVYYSRTADYLSKSKEQSLEHQVEGLWVSSRRAGFPPDYLRDQQIVKGKGMAYDVIFVPGFVFEGECPKDIREALQELVNAGKTVVVGKASKLDVDGLTRLETEFDEYDMKTDTQLRLAVDYSTEVVFQRTEETTAMLKDFLPEHTEPAAIHDGRVGPNWLSYNEEEVLIVPNWAYTGFTGLHKTYYQAPNVIEMKFPKRPPVCYDVLETERVSVKTEDDMMTLNANVTSYPGKIYAFLPRAIENVDMRVTSELKRGSDMNLQVQVNGPEGKRIDGSFPIKVEMLPPEGDAFLSVYRAAKPVFQDAYRIPANAATGAWTVRVTDLISGRVSEKKIQVEGEAEVEAQAKERDVVVFNEERIPEFINNLDDKEVQIPLAPSQEEIKPLAKKLQKKLEGRNVESAAMPLTEVLESPSEWDKESPVLDGTRLWRGDVIKPRTLADGPLVVMGTPGSNPYIDAALKRGLVPVPVTEDMPGRGRAVVMLAHKAFSKDHDALLVIGSDQEGLKQAVSELDSVLAGEKSGIPIHPEVAEASFSEDADLTAGKSAGREDISLRSRVWGEDQVHSLDVDPETGRILVGTRGYGQNIFCFDAEGNLEWKKFLPEHGVYRAQWYDDGKRVLAATSRGYNVFLMNGEDGSVFKKFDSTEWSRAQYREGAITTRVPIKLNPAKNQILIQGLTGLLAVSYEGEKMWFLDRTEEVVSVPKEADPGGASPKFPHTVEPDTFEIGPDGERIAYGEYRIVASTVEMKSITSLWGYRPAILDAETGEKLCTNKADPGSVTSPSQWDISWPDSSKFPVVTTNKDLEFKLDFDGNLRDAAVSKGDRLENGDFLKRTPQAVKRIGKNQELKWKYEHEWSQIKSLDRIDHENQRLYRCDTHGTIQCINLKDGNLLWTYDVPFPSKLDVHGKKLLAAGLAGNVTAINGKGEQLWHVKLSGLYEKPTDNYPEYIAEAEERTPDSSDEFYPASKPQPGDYDDVLRYGIEQVANKGFEKGAKHWQVPDGEVQLSSQARNGKKSAKLKAGQTLRQRIDKRVIPNGTYLLEFFYKPESKDAELAAGVTLEPEDGSSPDVTASVFEAPAGEWKFGRLAVKSMWNTKRLEVVFEASGDNILLDDTTMKPLRFPSANYLAVSQLHKVEPTYPEDFRIKYKQISQEMENKLRNKNRVKAFKQGSGTSSPVFYQEDAFLHNGRLDDVGDTWMRQSGQAMGFSCALREKSWVSHVVLYLNNARPQQTYNTIAVMVNDLSEDPPIPEVVDVVRNNTRRFIVVRFDEPRYTDMVTVLPHQEIKHQRDVLTEIELYGPVGGPEAHKKKSLAGDPSARSMFMGNSTHVPENRPPDISGKYKKVGGQGMHYRGDNHPALNLGITAAEDVFSLGIAGGRVDGAKAKEGGLRTVKSWEFGTLTPLTTPTRYAGRMLVGAADHKMHAIADNGSYMWGFQTEGRVHSAPAIRDNNVYFGSDDGKLYRADIDSGMLLWQFETEGRIRSSPAVKNKRVFVASFDGSLLAVHADKGNELWRAEIAPYTRASPAVRKNTLFIGDEKGKVYAFNAKDGSKKWERQMNERVSTCPLVLNDSVIFIGDHGETLKVDFKGNKQWRKDYEVRLLGQPIATESQILIPSDNGLLVHKQKNGKKVKNIENLDLTGNVISVLPYKDQVFLVRMKAYSELNGGEYFTTQNGEALLYKRVDAEKEE